MSRSLIIKIIFISIVSLLIFLIDYVFFFKTEYRVLHAGGLYKGQTYTNSIESFAPICPNLGKSILATTPIFG